MLNCAAVYFEIEGINLLHLKLTILATFVGIALFCALAGSPYAPARARSVAASLAAPTGFTASDGDYSTKVGLRWDAIRGAETYRVFRGSSSDPGSAAELGSTAANYFFDSSGVQGQAYFYWVRAENASTISALSIADQGTRSLGTVTPGAFSPLDPPPASAENPVTAAKAYLGKTLFWDEQMSSTRTVSCGTCHRPASGGSDPRTAAADHSVNPGPDNAFGTIDDIFGSPGVPQNNADGTYSVNPLFGFNEQVTNRKAPSYLNAGYAPDGLFWDGRATDAFRDPLTNAVLIPGVASLESQSVVPPVNASEMAHSGRDWTQVAARIEASRPLALAQNIPAALQAWIGGRTYPELFQEAFGTADVTPARIAMAIATHERTLFSDRTPFDRELYGIPSLTPQELSGANIFQQQQCITCHDGAQLSNHRYENIGVRPASDDNGRGGVTGIEDDMGRFKTPSLRNLELRAPYMHNGRFPNVEQVIEFYNRGGDFDAPNVDHGIIHPLNLTSQDKADLAAFLKRPLTDTRVQNELPPFDRPQLYTESTRVPVVSGSGRAGSGGQVPEPIAIAPPLLGNPNFTVALKNGIGGAGAYLSIGTQDPGIGTSIPSAGTFAYRSVTLSSGGAGGGYGSVNIAIPTLRSMIGRTYYGRWYVVDAAAANGFSVSRLFSFKIFSPDSSRLRPTNADFDGDGKTDVSVYRPASQGWYVQNSSGGHTEMPFGVPTDKMVPADYDGDGRTDIGQFRDGTWFTVQSTAGFNVFNFGTAGDIPQAADFDGDGKADYAVFRPSTGVWYVMGTTAGFYAAQFGQNGDKPVAADYDGDGKADFAVYRGGTWYLLRSTDGFTGVNFGIATDKPVIGDYDGDGKSDIAVWRPSDGVWYYMRSSDGTFGGAHFGVSTDVPAPGDYDGDGISDPAVFRDGVWYILGSTSGSTTAFWGVADDRPIPASVVP
ncbi:MAG: cytochrome c peroxidase [Acidobacteriota bacterium]